MIELQILDARCACCTQPLDLDFAFPNAVPLVDVLLEVAPVLRGTAFCALCEDQIAWERALWERERVLATAT